MIKKISFLAALVLVFSLAGCKYNSESKGADVITTSQPLQYLVENMIDQSETTAKCLLPIGGSGHEFDPSVGDISSIANAVAFVCMGAELEVWAADVFEGSGTKGAFVDASAGIALLESLESNENAHSHLDGHTDSHELISGHRHGADPHIWTSPKNMMIMAQTVYKSLCSLENGGGSISISEAAYNNLLTMLAKLDTRCAELAQLQKQSGKTLYFGDAFAFTYLMADYGFKFESAYPGCSDSVEPSLTRISDITKLMKSENAACIFKAEASNGEIAESIAQNTGARVVVLHSCHNVSKAEAQAKEDYFSLMTKNLDAIEDALKS